MKHFRSIRQKLTASSMLAGWIALGFGLASAAQEPVKGPRDLALTFASPFDGKPQPYRLYLPSAYDGTRTDTLHLGDPFGKLNHEVLEPNLLSAAWRFTQKNGNRISSKLEGRASEVTH